MKRNYRIWTALLAVCFLLSGLIGCAAKAPSGGVSNGLADGEVGTNAGESEDKPFWDGWFDGSSAMKPSAPGAADSADDSADGDYIYGGAMEGAPSGGEGGSHGGKGEGTSFEQQAGQLTGSEWNDNDHFDAFIEKLEGQGLGWYEIAAKWNLVASRRVHVQVKNEGKPVALASVVLYDTQGEVLYTAITDADGDAYLFYDLNRSLVAGTPAYVTVTGRDGQSVTHQLTEGERKATVELASTSTVTKLDVMFMIDTTGSMSDELEYLKAEMGDVIRRVASECNVSVRTSVNFYRDKGDEYELRYFDFREDVNEAVKLLAKQYAAGGGDYEEAVDTALDYAINQARWDNEAVKLVFLVLDAPPHYSADAIRSITASIKKAAEAGIRIIPVASSGVNTTCQVLFRTWAALTGGTYTYLTDHSGIGGSHQKPDVEEQNVELLNNMLVRIIKEYVVGGKQEDLITPVPGGAEHLIQGTKVKSIVIGTLPESAPREYASADMIARWVAWMYVVVVGNDSVEDPELPPGMIYVITVKYQDGSEQKMYFSGEFLGFGNRWYPVDSECREEFYEFINRWYPEDGEDRVEFEK